MLPVQPWRLHWQAFLSGLELSPGRLLRNGESLTPASGSASPDSTQRGFERSSSRHWLLGSSSSFRGPREPPELG